MRYDLPLHFVFVLTGWLPDNVPFLRLRGRLARPFLASCGRNLRLGRNVTFYNPSMIHLGEDIYIAYGCWFMAGERITVDDETLFGPYCVVVSANHTQRAGSFRYGATEEAPIKIGKGTWLGSHVTVTAGAGVGDGSLIAAGAVVTSEIPSGVAAGGVPARVLKTLPNESSAA